MRPSLGSTGPGWLDTAPVEVQLGGGGGPGSKGSSLRC